MQKFYHDYDSIHRFTLSLDYHQNKLECGHCSKSNQFVSHGVIYKQRSSTLAEKVGKRIFCSNRSGRKGCGRTFQIYIASEIPSLRYGAAQLFIFITALLANLTLSEAYYQATGQNETRHAWRWLARLTRQLSEYRTFLKVKMTSGFPSHNRLFIHLLPTLAQLFTPTKNGCSDYQIHQQKSFF